MNHIKFSESYDVHRLRSELDGVIREEWPLHFNTKDYNGDWRSISLRSVSGESRDIIAHPDGQYRDTPALARMPYVRTILDGWPFEKESVRLLSLAPGAEILPHKDLGCTYHEGPFRIHIPIVTNSGVIFTIDGERLQLAAGECWYMNFGATHSIVNHGDAARIHLVVDGLRNDWTDGWFTAHGYTLPSDDWSAKYDDAEKSFMIAELEKMDTDTARNIIAHLKAQP